METMKVQIGFLNGKVNWNTRKCKLCVLLRGIPGATDVIEGRLLRPVPVSSTASTEERMEYDRKVEYFTKADTSALLVLTTNMTEEILQKVMRFTTARNVWLELHRLFDGKTEDKTYELCTEFFSYK